ncbi:MAG: C40 family peptidase [Candidatus Aminicenantaceae bacterium]
MINTGCSRGGRCRAVLGSERMPGRIAAVLSAAAILLSLVLAGGCARKPQMATEVPPPVLEKERPRAGFTIQVGAFRNLSNAVRLTHSLADFGLNVYYFKHESGLYKVRFGDFSDRSSAEKMAEKARARGFIEGFYIINPETSAVAREAELGTGYLRNEIVSRAENFLGIPYQWGGTSPENGFDCSGLTMAVYNLVGLSLPRTSHAQFSIGTPVSEGQLARGDLVFFQTSNSSRVTHVGIFTGGESFIHAPGKSKKIRVDSLNSSYFRRRFAGARTYLK